jgi:hypothetical protein
MKQTYCFAHVGYSVASAGVSEADFGSAGLQDHGALGARSSSADRLPTASTYWPRFGTALPRESSCSS